MQGLSTYLLFVRKNAPFLGVGALLMGLSSFGQTFFIAVFGGDIRAAFNLTNGEWGLIYMIGTMASAGAMLMAGGLVDLFRVRSIGIAVVLLLGIACLGMALNTSAAVLVIVIFFLRFFGQGMTHHVAAVAMSRWLSLIHI